MNSNEAYLTVKNHQWIMYAGGSTKVIMGKNGGVISIEFLSDFTLDSESGMEFWPFQRRWAFDEENQIIQLFDFDGKVAKKLSLPVKTEFYYEMRNLDNDDVFKCYYGPDNVRNEFEIRDTPFIPADKRKFKGSKEIIIQFGGSEDSALYKSGEKFFLDTVILSNKEEIDFEKLYEFLISNPQLKKITIALASFEMKNYPFNEVQESRLYVDDLKSFFDMDGETFQQLSTSLFIGDREVIMEMLSLFVLGSRLDLDSDEFSRILITNFGSRLVHGRKVTTKPGYGNDNSWIEVK